MISIMFEKIQMIKFTIGQLAQKVGVNIQTIRYYEKFGLIEKNIEEESGYRKYSESDVEKMQFIRRAKDLGFTLKEISELLSLKIEPTTKCKEIRKITDERIASIELKIFELNKMKDALSKVAKMCDKPNAPICECPILNALSSEDEIKNKCH